MIYNYQAKTHIIYQLLTYVKMFQVGGTLIDSLTLVLEFSFLLMTRRVNGSLCSRNFQKVKLRLLIVEISTSLRFYVKSMCNILEVQKMSFLAILEVLNLDFSKFEPFFKSQIYQNRYSYPLELPKITFFDRFNSPKFDFT